MPNARQRAGQRRLRTLNQRLEELSAVPSSAGHAEEFVALFQEKRHLEASFRADPTLGVAGCPAPEFRIFRTVEDGVFGIWIRAEPGGGRRNGWVQKSAPALVVPRPPPCPWPSKAQEVVIFVYRKCRG